MSTPPETTPSAQTPEQQTCTSISTAKTHFQTEPSFVNGLPLIEEIEQDIQQLDDEILASVLQRGCIRVRNHARTGIQKQLPDSNFSDVLDDSPVAMPGQQTALDEAAQERQEIISLLGGMDTTLHQMTSNETKPLSSNPQVQSSAPQ